MRCTMTLLYCSLLLAPVGAQDEPGLVERARQGVQELLQRLLDDQPLIIFGDGEQTRDYVYVKDVVSANMRASDLGLGDTVDMDEVAFNVGTGEGTRCGCVCGLRQLWC